MRAITIVGGGQSGLQLGCGLVKRGYDVQIIQNRTPEQIRSGNVLSGQCMFGAALQNERDLELDFWEDSCPTIDSITFCVPAPDGSGQKAIDWNGRLDRPARSVDQRVKIPAWMAEFERRGGHITIDDVGIEDLERYARGSDLVIVATGRNEIAQLFERDVARSPFDKPQRALAATYVHGMVPRAEYSAVNFNLIPTVGEYFVFPALTVSGPCDIMVFEGLPNGPMDCWTDVKTPTEHLDLARRMLETFLPWEAERCRNLELTDSAGILSGRFAPTVRKPIGVLPSGALVLGMADAVCLNDPIAGQGSNSASKAAKIYMDAIIAHADGPFDAAFMQATFNAYWSDAHYVVDWSNSLLKPPPPHVLKLMDAAQNQPALARRLANAFDRPADLFPWFVVPEEADRYLNELAVHEG